MAFNPNDEDVDFPTFVEIIREKATIRLDFKEAILRLKRQHNVIVRPSEVDDVGTLLDFLKYHRDGKKLLFDVCNHQNKSTILDFSPAPIKSKKRPLPDEEDPRFAENLAEDILKASLESKSNWIETFRIALCKYLEFDVVAEYVESLETRHFKASNMDHDVNIILDFFKYRDDLVDFLIGVIFYQAKHNESKAKRLKEEKEKEKEEERSNDNEGSKNCSICMENPKEVVFLPCGHLSCCSECSKQVKTCPICRKDINQATKVFVV